MVCFAGQEFLELVKMFVGAWLLVSRVFEKSGMARGGNARNIAMRQSSSEGIDV